MPHHLPHLHYPEKEPLVKKLFRQLDVNGYEEDRRIRSTFGAFVTILMFVLIIMAIYITMTVMQMTKIKTMSYSNNSKEIQIWKKMMKNFYHQK